MTKKISLALLCLFALNFSCSSNDNEGDSTSKPLGVEEGKVEMEDNMVELLNKVDAFRDDDALNEIIELAEFLNGTESAKSGNFKNTALNTINNVSTLKTEDLAAFNTKQSLTLVSETPLTDDFNDEKGVYEWNTETEDFDKTDDSEDIIYKVNYNGKLAVFSFTDFNATVAGASGSQEEVPTLAKANLKINDKTVFTQNFSASFNSNDLVPTNISNTTTIGGFEFVTTYSNTNSKLIKQSFEFKLSNDVIIGYELTSNGDFSNKNDDLEDGDAEDIFDDVTLKLQILEANLTLTANDDNLDSDSDLSVDEQITLLNNNVKAELSVKGSLLAKSLFYKDQDTYTDWEYNSATGQFDTVEVTEDIVNAKFIFDDGTSSDFETYFEGSFTDLENKYDAVFDAYETLFENM